MSVWIVSLLLVITLILLITEKIPVDLTAIGIMTALMITKILTPAEAVAGFANPAVITVGAMFLISKAMIRTGALGFVAQRIIKHSKGNANLAMLLVLLIVAFASAFVNNTPIVVLFIPIILNLSCEYDLSPSKFLIPVSYASILAGTCTLIGTSTNIIVRDLSVEYGYGNIGMFELSALGIPIAVIGITFLFFAAPRLMPSHAAPTCDFEDREDKKYLAELRIPQDSPLIGKEPSHLFKESHTSFKILEIIHDNHIFYPERDNILISEKDILLVKGNANDFIAILRDNSVELPHVEAELNFNAEEKDSLIAELIIPPQSLLPGQKFAESMLQDDPDIHIIAIKRRRIHYTEQKLRNMTLRVGDILLIRCKKKKLDRMRGDANFIVVEDVHHEIIHKAKAGKALVIFAGMIIAASTGIADIMVCALTAVFLMVITGCLQLWDAYRELRGDVLLLIVGTIALGVAMEKTGTSKIYAEAFLTIFQDAGPSWVLAGLILLTSISTQLLSNNATAVLLLPIAISTAVSMGVSPKPFIIAVCFGASACFATPIGYKTNLLVYGPGAYRFSDYLRLGIPLNLIVLIMGAVFIPMLWNF